MPNTSDSPAETRNSSPASASALRSCSIRLATGWPLEVLRAALRGHLVAGIGRQDLRDRVRILRVLHRLHREAGLHGLVIALAHQERALEAVVARVFPGLDDLVDVVGAGLRDHLDRKSTRLNSSHRCNSYAVFCL